MHHPSVYRKFNFRATFRNFKIFQNIKIKSHTYKNQQDYGTVGTSSSFPPDMAGAAARSRRRRSGLTPRRRGGPPCARGRRTAGALSPPPSALVALKGEVNILFASILNYPAHWKEDIVRLNFCFLL